MADDNQGITGETAVGAWTVYDSFHFYGTDANLIAEKLGLPLESKRGTVQGVPYDVMTRIPKDRLNEYADRLLELNVGMVIDDRPRVREVDTVKEKLSALSALPALDDKLELAAAVLTDALLQNEQLLALAGAGAEWQRGTGRSAVFNGEHYETLVGKYRDELLDLLGDKIWANNLENRVKGEVYRRLDEVAYDRFVLDEYADATKSGRLDTYETPYPEDSESKGVLVYLTERLPSGGVHDYGYIYGYDPDDNRDHAINNYLSLKSFNELRESVFGKPETTVTLSFRETQPIGSTVLRPLLFVDGQFNRENKRTRVEVLPPMGKYSVYAQHFNNVTGDNTAIHIATDSGYLLPMNADRTNFEKRYFEAYIDRVFEKANAQLDEMLSDPSKFAPYQQAAITGRIAETEAHNAVYRQIKNGKDQERRNEIAAQQAEAEKEKTRLHAEQVQENAVTLAGGGKFKVEASQYSGKNNLLELFSLYDVDVPLATKGWFNNKLVTFEGSQHGGYSYSSYNNKGKRFSEMSHIALTKLRELRKAIQTVPVTDKLIEKGLIAEPATEGSNLKRKYIKASFGNESGLAYRIYTDVNGKIEAYNSDFSQKITLAPTFKEAVSRLLSEGYTPWKMDINDSTVFEGETTAVFAAELAKIGVTIDIDGIERGLTQKTLDAFAEKHGFGTLTAEFYSKTQEETEPQNVIIREGAEQHELFHDNISKIANGGRITPEHLAAYLTRLETSKAVSVVGHDDLTLYDVDVIKSRRDYQVRERQNKLGRDTDLPLPAVKDCAVGDTVLVYNPGTRSSSYMNIARVEKHSVILQDVANSFQTEKISLDRFRSEQGFNLTGARTIDIPARNEQPKTPAPRSEKPDFLAKININKERVERDKAAAADAPAAHRKKDKEV